MADKFTYSLSETATAAAQEPGSLFFVGTATTVIRYAGFTILTDPNFLHAGDHAHLGYGIKTERRTNPAIDIEELPPLDLCVLSHFHGDHWDQVATEKLPKSLPVVTTEHAAAALRDEGFRSIYPLDTWESFVAQRGSEWLRVTALPGRHGPAVAQIALPPVMGSLLEWGTGDSAPRLRMYISGDTLVYDDLKEIPERFPNIDLGVLHLGGTKLLGLLLTMDAEQGIQIIQMIQPRHVVPIHYNDYPVFESPIEDFLRAAEKAGLSPRVHYLRHGDTFTFDRLFQ